MSDENKAESHSINNTVSVIALGRPMVSIKFKFKHSKADMGKLWYFNPAHHTCPNYTVNLYYH